jgi:transcription termination factor Rho
MVLDQARFHLSQGGEVLATGFLELTADHGVLRWPAFSLKPGPNDVHVPSALLRPFDLRPGLMLRCALRLPQERERGRTDVRASPAAARKPPDFTSLPALPQSAYLFWKQLRSF